MEQELDHQALLATIDRTFTLQTGVSVHGMHANGQAPTPAADSPAIRVNIDGELNGFVAAVLSEEAATTITAQVLSRVLERDMPIAEISPDLACNTVGELLNFILGEFVTHMRNTRASMIKAPVVESYAQLQRLMSANTHQITINTPAWFFSIVYDLRRQFIASESHK